MKPASLNGISGLGELKVMRAAEGEVDDIAGIWRLDDDNPQDVASLREANRSASTVTYRGPVVDPKYADVADTEIEVAIVSIDDYVYEHGDEKVRTLYKMKAQPPLPYEGAIPEANRRQLGDEEV